MFRVVFRSPNLGPHQSPTKVDMPLNKETDREKTAKIEKRVGMKKRT